MSQGHGRGRPWQPGMPSPNPKGRPKNAMSLAFEIRSADTAAEMVTVALEIMRKGTIAEKLQALTWLASNGYQRPAERHEVIAANVSQIEAQRVLATLSEAALRELANAVEQPQLPEGKPHDDND